MIMKTSGKDMKANNCGLYDFVNRSSVTKNKDKSKDNPERKG